MVDLSAYNEFKYWATFGGILWSVFKGFTWIKDFREKDVAGIKNDLSAVSTDIKQQTSVIGIGFTQMSSVMDRGFQELRSDFRHFYSNPDPIMAPVASRAQRKKQSTALRKKAKSRPKQVSTKPPANPPTARKRVVDKLPKPA